MHTLNHARSLGWRRVILVGDEPYYRRFGFTREAALDLDFPKPISLNRLLAKELVEGAMAGVYGMVHRWSDRVETKNE
jgi:predicted N-acetyltransferase YhbS